MDKGSEVDARVDARAQSCAIIGIIIVLAPPHCNQYTAAVVIKAESGPGLLGMGRVIIQDQGACAGWRTRAGEQMIGIERVPLDPLDHLLS